MISLVIAVGATVAGMLAFTLKDKIKSWTENRENGSGMSKITLNLIFVALVMAGAFGITFLTQWFVIEYLKTEGWTNKIWAFGFSVLAWIIAGVIVDIIGTVKDTKLFWLAIISTFAILLVLGFMQNGKPEIPCSAASYQTVTPVKSTISTVTITEPGAFNFKLEPWQNNGQWLYVPADLKYSFSSPPGQPFVIRYKRGDRVVVGGDEMGVKIPDRAGSFRVQALDSPVSVTLMVSRHQ